MDRLETPLKKQFEKHRIVFWYDTKKELKEKFEAIDIPGVEKVEIKNNEFQLKYRILREAPDTKFLLYHEGPQPEDIKNWLLDVLLSHGDFRTDQAAIWLNELGLQPEFLDVVDDHKDFFNAVKRREGLKKLLKNDDTKSHVRLKMIAVCAGTEPRLDNVMEELLSEQAEGRDEAKNLLKKTELGGLLWKRLFDVYGYSSDKPGVEDFAIALFSSCYAQSIHGEGKLTPEAMVFLKRWKDSRKHQHAFEKLSDRYAEILNIKDDLENRDYRDLMEMDYFRIIDQKILHGLASEVTGQTIPPGECSIFVRQRRQCHWFDEMRHMYDAVENASKLISKISGIRLDMTSLYDGINKYVKVWGHIDRLYRKYILSVQRAGNPKLLNTLTDMIENLYTNSFLLKINDNWQQQIDSVDEWDASPIPSQRVFFKRWVSSFLDKDKKVCVVISDGLRYEAGEELVGRIRREDRYDAQIEPALSMLPSFTQLGMAALLPHQEINLIDNGKVLLDGESSQGTACRDKILKKAVPGGALALRSDDLLSMTGDEAREMFRENQVVYIYHNRIDEEGDKKETESRTFEAVEQTQDELIAIIKKLTSANASNLIITADHGFIYQHRPLQDSDFSGAEVTGETISYQDRRFVLGRGLTETPGLKKFSMNEVGIQGDTELLIPKSINRLRLKGSGSRYVHGGSSLQEVVVPVIHINKKRTSDISAVEVDILKGTTEVITTGQLTVIFYQAQPVTEKIKGRQLRAGIYSAEGKLVSDSHELNFDLVSENPREREVPIRFLLSRDADGLNNQEVILKLEEKYGSTTTLTVYKSARYRLRRSFTSDFDF